MQAFVWLFHYLTILHELQTGYFRGDKSLSDCRNVVLLNRVRVSYLLVFMVSIHVLVVFG